MVSTLGDVPGGEVRGHFHPLNFSFVNCRFDIKITKRKLTI